MRSPAPPLLPIFRSHHQAALLTDLYLHPDREVTLGDLASRLGITPPTLHREVERLVESGLVRSRSVGRTRLLSAATEHRAAAALTDLLAVTFGPEVVIRETFDLAGSEIVLIFGSWAARYRGERGRPPGDVDVLVVGDVRRQAVYAAADEAGERLSMEVNPVLRPLRAWTETADSLVAQIKNSPMVVLIDRHQVTSKPSDHEES